MNNFNVTVDADGIALILFDVAGQSMNTLNSSVIEEFRVLIERMRTEPAWKGVVIASGKTNAFCGGADLGDLIKIAGTRIAAPALSADFRALETCGKPVAIAFEGLSVGGGLEMALACHYRVASDAPGVRFGLPEVTVGLLPGAGGTQRLARLLGAGKALPLLLEGKLVPAAEAKALGFIDELVAPGEAVAAAKRWIIEHGDPVARWDKKDFRVPGGTPYSPAGSQTFMMANAMLRIKTFENYPAASNILKSVFEGIQVPIEAGLRIESRYFVNTFATPQARAMIHSLFLARQELAKGSARPSGIEKTRPKVVGIIGAGMMGAGIAYSQAAKGIDTILVDLTQERADKGKGYSRTLVEKAVKRGKLSDKKGKALLKRIKPTCAYEDLAAADIVIEAVFEDPELKRDTVRQIEAIVSPDVLIGSNTSTLPISGLAKASARPENFVGIHFFSPVDRMELVEVIRGKETGDEAVARAIDYVIAIGKVPIVVNDSRGFYTSRCFGTYIYEGLEMLSEGIAPAIIDNVGRMTGMPRGPLELNDDIAIDLTVRIAEQTREALGDAYVSRPYEALAAAMVADGRFGRKNRRGFYDYPEDGPKRLWAGLSELAPVKIPTASTEDVAVLRNRLLYRQAIEVARCFAEQVVTDPREADVGAILGWGFAPWTGGPLSLIDSIGAGAFVEACDALAAVHGDRFSPPALLRKMAERGVGFYDPELADMLAA